MKDDDDDDDDNDDDDDDEDDDDDDDNDDDDEDDDEDEDDVRNERVWIDDGDEINWWFRVNHENFRTGEEFINFFPDSFICSPSSLHLFFHPLSL